MLGLDDNRWSNLTGGYRTAFDPRPLLARLETEHDTAAVWHELWEELHHQGDLGEASYASVPHLVRIHRTSGIIAWNSYGARNSSCSLGRRGFERGNRRKQGEGGVPCRGW